MLVEMDVEASFFKLLNLSLEGDEITILSLSIDLKMMQHW